MFRIQHLTAVILAVLAAPCVGQTAPEYFHIDFEQLPDASTPPEGTVVATQYADPAGNGVTFAGIRPDGSTTDVAWLPIIAVEGGAAVAFGSSAGNDEPMTWGSRGLAARAINNERGGLLMSFLPPITSVQFFLVDLDSGSSDTATVIGFNGTTEVARVTVAAGDPGTGDGISTPISLAGAQITSVQVLVTPTSLTTSVPGWALDSLSFTRALVNPQQGPFVRVSQESLPGVADFDDHVLGVVRPWQAPLVPAPQFYLYRDPPNNSFFGFALDPVAERSHLLVANTTEGTSLFWVHDRPGNADGGHAETRVDTSMTCTSAVRDDTTAVDSSDLNSPPVNGTGNLFTGVNNWDAAHTDGQAISGLAGSWTALLQFTPIGTTGLPPIEGLGSWVVYSSEGGQVSLPLIRDTRVELRPVEPCELVVWPSRAQVCLGGSVVLHATISGAGPFGYQWRVGGTPLSGATLPTILISTPQQAGEYDCVVTGPCGTVLSNHSQVSEGTADFDADGDVGTDADIEAFFACLAGRCCPLCGSSDFNGDGDVGTDADIESFFRVLAGGPC